jgi:DNA-binding NtrC family response regulator
VKILIAKTNPNEAAELSEYFRSNACEVFIASERRQVYQELAAKDIDAVLFNVACLDDFAVIRYINATYPSIKVVVTSDAGLSTYIDNVRQGAFTALKPHYHLNQLQELILADTAKPTSKPGSRN